MERVERVKIVEEENGRCGRVEEKVEKVKEGDGKRRAKMWRAWKKEIDGGNEGNGWITEVESVKGGGGWRKWMDWMDRETGERGKRRWMEDMKEMDE